MSSRIVRTSDLSNYTICSLPQSRKTIPLGASKQHHSSWGVVSRAGRYWNCSKSTLNVVVYLLKIWEIQKKYNKVIASALVTTYWVILYMGIKRCRISFWFQKYKLTSVTKCTFQKLLKKTMFLE
jgi:hypothetical protein